MNETKICRTCKEEINNKATWCPRCHRPQSLFRSIFPPQALALLIIGLAGYWYLTYEAMGNSFDQFTNGSIYETTDIMKVFDTKIKIKKEGCETCVTTIGKLKNNSDQAYGSIHLQVTYFNANNEIVDVVNDEDSDLVIGPHSEGAFRVKSKSAAHTSEYVKAEVKITKIKPDVGFF